LIKEKNILRTGHSPVLKAFWFSIGMVLSGIGMIGIIVPGLPTTIFMILASACFFRSSRTMYQWVVNHPIFGNHVLRFRKGEGMPLKAKYISIITMWGFVVFAVFFALPSTIIWVKYFILLSAVTGTFYIIKQPGF
tara:strand:- start:92 stop:499 length:408 start_codon:yes stop_codon:yes gene_type:complete